MLKNYPAFLLLREKARTTIKVVIGLLALALFQATPAIATTCANAIVINPASLPITNQALVCGAGNDMSATSVPGAICGSGSGDYYKGGNEALYMFTPTTTAAYQLSYTGQSWSAAMVYIGCPTLNNCLYGAGQTGTSVGFAVTLNAGTTYYIWFDTWPTPNSPCPGTFSLGPPPPPISNDNPCQATPLTVNPALVCTAQTPGSLVGATTTTTVPTTPCYGTPNDDVWFSFVATGTTHFISLNNVSGSPTDLYHAVYSGTCSSLTNIICSDNDNSTVTGLIPGNTYWVRVYSYSSSSGATSTFNVCVTTPPPPPPPPACGGMFYDDGGPTGNYSASAAQTTTICPSTPGDMVSLIFSQFNLENNYDQLRIYDGNSTAGALLGTYTGNTLPPLIMASNPTGCLTAVFTSDGSGQYAGWAAQVNCAPLPAGDCIYLLNLRDSGGNGWGTSSVGVRINGGPWTYYTVTTFSNFVLIGVNLGDLIELNYTVATGPNQNQNSYSISKLGANPYFTSLSPPAPGITFIQTVTCGPPPAQPQDCAGGITVCSSQAITNNSASTGDVMDLNSSNQGCLSSGERQGTWYYFSPQTNGTIAFSIAPANGTDDYDFAVWGPYASAQCPTGPPLRCSYDAPGPYTTGLSSTATQPSEGAGGTGWVMDIAATAGQVYVLYIDNFSSTGQAFTLSWQLSNGSSLDCTTLPVELIALEATANDPVIEVTWATATEHDSHHFTVERSPDNEMFTPIGTVDAAGNAQFRNDYLFVDEDPFRGVNYYRLEQVDIDGTTMRTHIVVATLSDGDGRPSIYPNPASDMLNVVFPNPMDKPVKLVVLDALGRAVASVGASTLPGQRAAQMPIEHLAPGWYSLRIDLPDGGTLPGGQFLKRQGQ